CESVARGLPSAWLDAECRHRHLAALGRNDQAGDDDSILFAALEPVAFLEEQRVFALIVDLQLADFLLLLLPDLDAALFESLVESDKFALILVGRMNQEDGKVLMGVRSGDFQWAGIGIDGSRVARRPRALTSGGDQDGGQNQDRKSIRFAHGQPPE